MENYELKRAKQALLHCVVTLATLATLTTLAFVKPEWLQIVLLGCTLVALTLAVVGAQHVWKMVRNPFNL